MKKILIAGLGNPGEQYKKTRHNIGFLILEALVKSYSIVLKSNQNFESATYSDIEKQLQIIFLKPLEYMNLSGNVISQVQKKYSISIGSILVIHDELDFDFLKYKIKFGGGTAGHNGLKSITERLSSPDYHRLRVGISRPENNFISISDYVLSNFTSQELEQVQNCIPDLVEEINLWITKNLEQSSL